MFKKDNEYYLWCSEFEGLDDHRDVLGEAKEVLERIEAFGGHDSLLIDDLDVRYIDHTPDNGKGGTYMHLGSAEIVIKASPSRMIETLEDGTEVVVDAPADQTYEWTKLAREDEKVGELARLLNQDDNWVNLYRRYEFIQGNIFGAKNTVDRGWWTKKQKRLFKRTANSRGAVGDEARHGSTDIPAPDDPVTVAEAKRLIDTLVDNWLHHRRKRLDTTTNSV